MLVNNMYIMIEKGRHLNIEREYGCCPFCLNRNIYVIEDEFHFFMVCPTYNDLRILYFNTSWRAFITVQHFYSIMHTCDTSLIILETPGNEP